MQIVAVVFCSFDERSLLLKPGEAPYFYVDMVGASEGDYALVHNGKAFGIVQVVRRIDPATSPVAVQYVTKPLLCRVFYDPEVNKEASKKLAEFQFRTSNLRIQQAIDEKLSGSAGTAKRLKFLDDDE
jgi:hypothetical protein